MLLTVMAVDPGPNPTVLIAVISTVGVLLSGLIATWAARYTARKSTEATTETARVQERQVDVTEWQAIIEALRGETTRLGGRVDDLDKKDVTSRGRITELEKKVSEGDVKYRAAISYIRDLVFWARAAAGHPPTAPVAIADDLRTDILGS